MNYVNYDELDWSKDIHSCFQCKQMSTYVDNLITRYRAFTVLGEKTSLRRSSVEHVYFYLMESEGCVQ